ncbi:MAG: hypothetical protein ACRCX2_07275 [Paraclostridium sp.]
MIPTAFLKKIFKHICFTLITNIFKKFFTTVVQEELIIGLIKHYVESTKSKKDDDFFNIAFGDTKFKIKKQ